MSRRKKVIARKIKFSLMFVAQISLRGMGHACDLLDAFVFCLHLFTGGGQGGDCEASK
jgi:hypothetical protein